MDVVGRYIWDPILHSLVFSFPLLTDGFNLVHDQIKLGHSTTGGSGPFGVTSFYIQLHRVYIFFKSTRINGDVYFLCVVILVVLRVFAC